MKAINLIPQERRRGGGAGAAGRSGGAVYVVLGTLAVLVVMMGVAAISGKGVKDDQARASALSAQADAAEAEANKLAPYANFTALRKARVDTVASLAKSRFDWSDTMHDIATTIPKNVWLTQLVGTITPAVSVEGGSSDTSALRGRMPVPAVEIVGCTTDQQSVARMMSHMRALPRVVQVSLGSSEKADSAAGGAGDAATSADCRNGSSRFPKFSLVVFFRAPDPVAAAPSATATPTPASTGGS